MVPGNAITALFLLQSAPSPRPSPTQGSAPFLPLHSLPLSALPSPSAPTLSSFIRASTLGIWVLHLHLHLGPLPPMLHTTKVASPSAFPSSPAPQSHLLDHEGRPGSRAHPALDGHGGHVLEHHVLHFTAERSSRGTRSLGQGQGRRCGRGKEVGPEEGGEGGCRGRREEGRTGVSVEGPVGWGGGRRTLARGSGEAAPLQAWLGRGRGVVVVGGAGLGWVGVWAGRARTCGSSAGARGPWR